MNSVFIDTWGFLSLRDKREKAHIEVTQFFTDFLNKKVEVFTTDYVLDETFTLLFKRLDINNANKSILLFEKLIETDNLVVERISKARFNETVMLRKKYLDKPDISFTDLSSMVVMDELNIKHILTGDDHFQYVGKGFIKLPG